MSDARPYDMSRRARKAAATTERILDELEALIVEQPIGTITLDDIAARADVSVQTVLRRFDSRDGCFDAIVERIGARHRDTNPPGDIGAAVDNLIEHYEAEGRLVLGLLAQESTSALASSRVEERRAIHRAWIERSFAPLIELDDDDARQRLVDALVAATDIYTWKLLRLDLDRDAVAVRTTIEDMIRALLEHAHSRGLS